MKYGKKIEFKSSPSLDLLDKLILSALLATELDEDKAPAAPVNDASLPFCDGACDVCDACDAIDGYEVDDELIEEDLPMYGIPDVEYIVFNPPATIVFWEDGTKTVVKAMEGEKFERYAGFAAACMKKMFGSTARAKAVMEDCDQANWKKALEEEKPTEKPAAPEKPKSNPSPAASFSLSEFVDIFSAALVDTIRTIAKGKGFIETDPKSKAPTPETPREVKHGTSEA